MANAFSKYVSIKATAPKQLAFDDVIADEVAVRQKVFFELR
jgi:hypothetical protein